MNRRGSRNGFGNVERVVALAEVNIESSDAIVIDAVDSFGNRRSAGSRAFQQRDGIDGSDPAASIFTLESDDEDIANFGDSDVVGKWLRCVVARIERIQYRSVRIQNRIQSGAQICSGGVEWNCNSRLRQRRAAWNRNIQGQREGSTRSINSQCLNI